MVVVHRRSGKTSLLLALLSMAMLQRVGTYYNVTPHFVTGRRIVWDALAHAGRPMLDAFPRELMVAKNETEMQITLRNGSVFQVLGADQADRLRGANSCRRGRSRTGSSRPGCSSRSATSMRSAASPSCGR